VTTGQTTKQVLDADPEMAYLIDHLPDYILWRAEPDSSEDRPVVRVIEIIEGRFVDRA
jgi:hypothetical protein